MTSQHSPKPFLSRRRFLQVTSLGLAASAAGTLGFDLAPEQIAALKARQMEGTLRVAWGTPVNLDPLFASADSEIAFLNAVYDYLVDTNAASELVSRLASEWVVSDDGLTYTFMLQEGVTFHDGSELTPADVVWTFDRLREDPESATGNLYANVTSVEAGEGNTVIFTLSETNPNFLFDIADNRALILKEGAENVGEDFNGTGPFALNEYLPGDRAVFDANENYWAGAPGVATLEFLYFDDNQAAISALQGGVVDIAVRMDNATFLSLSGNADFNAVDIPTNGHDVVRIQVDEGPGSDPRVVQALKLATDREDIFTRVQLGFGAVGKDSPIGPQFGEYFLSDLELPARDVDAARALLEEAGFGDGLDLTLYVPQSGDRVTLAEAIAAQWSEAGINLTIEAVPEGVYYSNEGQNWLTATLGITGWGSRPEPQFYLENAYRTGARWNESQYSNEEVDALIDLAGTTLDQEERTQAYQRIQQILAEEGPVIVPYFFAALMVTDTAVDGVALHPFPGRTNFSSATIG
jgi:peptide/nickel transport system substrate-binding protein